MFSTIILLAFLGAATAFDIRRRRIPNALTIPLMGAGLAAAWIQHGASGLGWAAAGLLVGGLVLLPSFVLGGMGAGDVKLLAGVGAFLGPVAMFECFLLIALLGAVLAVALLLLKKRSLKVVQEQAQSVWLTWITRRNHMFFGTENPDDPVRLPYAVPIALGTFVFVLWP